MNNQILELEKLSRALHESTLQLLEEDKLTKIDRDHLKQRCIALYDQILALSPTEFHEEVIPEPEVHEEKPAIPAETEPVIQTPLFIEETSKAKETAIEKHAAKTETEIRNQHIDTILEVQQNQRKDQPTEPELSLHEKIAHTIEAKENLIEKLSASIPSLKNAINVNLKIAFVNQLFNENTVEYVKAIDKLNSCENIHEAMRYFNELKHSYSWDSENANVKELEQLLHKRYNS